MDRILFVPEKRGKAGAGLPLPEGLFRCLRHTNGNKTAISQTVQTQSLDKLLYEAFVFMTKFSLARKFNELLKKSIQLFLARKSFQV